MRLLSMLLLLSVPGLSFGEECTTQTETIHGKTMSMENCSAVVEDAVKADVEGYRFAAYIVHWKGQRVVAVDPTARSNVAKGELLSFSVARVPLDHPASPTEAKYLMVVANGAASASANPK